MLSFQRLQDDHTVGWTLVSASRLPRRHDPAFHLLPAHRARAAGRRRGDLAQADGAGRTDPPGRLRAVVVAARRMARPSADRADRARGDERHRRPGDADAGAPSGRAVAAHRPLRDRRAVQAPRTAGADMVLAHDPRGDRHRPRRGRRALLPRPAADPLPLPDQGARRAAPARRRAAHPRVHHEGLLHVRPRRGGPRRRLRAARRRLRPDVRPLRAGVVPRGVRRRDDGRPRRRRVHGAVRGGRERRRAGARATRPTSRSPAPRPSRSSCPSRSTPPSSCTRRAQPRSRHSSGSWASPREPP